MDEKTAREEEPAETPAPTEGDEPVQKVTTIPGGAKRQGFFKERDYPAEE